MISNMMEGFTPIAEQDGSTLEIDAIERLVISDGINTSWILWDHNENWRIDGPLAATGKIREMLFSLGEIITREKANRT